MSYSGTMFYVDNLQCSFGINIDITSVLAVMMFNICAMRHLVALCVSICWHFDLISLLRFLPFLNFLPKYLNFRTFLIFEPEPLFFNELMIHLSSECVSCKYLSSCCIVPMFSNIIQMIL